MLQQVALGGAMIALPLYLQMILEYNAMEAGLSLAPLSLTHVRGRARSPAGRPGAGARPASSGPGSRWLASGCGAHHPDRPARATAGGAWSIPLLIAGCGLGLLVSQLNNYTLAPIAEERVSEAAG